MVGFHMAYCLYLLGGGDRAGDGRVVEIERGRAHIHRAAAGTSAYAAYLDGRASREAQEASAEATTAPADVNFSIKSLASAFSGFRRVSQLAAWGLASGEPDAVARADALFATRHAPHSPDHF